MGVEALYNLVHWPWGAQAVFANSAAKKYIFSRSPKAQGIAKRRYELVDKAIEMNSKTKSTNAFVPLLSCASAPSDVADEFDRAK